MTEIERDTVEYNDPTPFDNSKLQSIDDIIKAIRHKMYGKDVREPIAQLGEALIKLLQETGGNQTAEVIAARGKYETLGIREDAQDNAIVKAQSTANGKFDTSQAESYLKSITALPETFANLAAIKDKYPNGHNGLMVAADNGHKYIWDGTDWTDAGIYQSAGLANGSVTTAKRTPLGDWATVSTRGIPNIDTSNRTINFGDGYLAVVYRNYGDSLPDFAGKDVQIGDTDADGNFVFYNTIEKVIWYNGKLGTASENDVVLGYCFWSSKKFNFNFDFTIDGKAQLTDSSVPTSSLEPLSFKGQLLCIKPLIIDPESKTITFPDAFSAVLYNNKSITLAERNSVWNLSEREPNYIAFNTNTRKLESLARLDLLEWSHIYLGYINWGNNLAVDLSANYNVKHSMGTGSVQKKWVGKKLVALGDSITNGDNGIGSGGNSISWVKNMGLRCGSSTVENKGVNGSTVSIISGQTTSFVERCTDIVAVNGVITVFGGINDFHSNVPLGTFMDGSNETFYGAYQYVITTLLENNPDAKLLAITPMKTTKFTSTYKDNGDLNPNSTGATQVDYVNAIKTVAGYLGVPVLDLFNESNMNPYIKSHEKWFGDGLHPLEIGYVRLADQIASKIELL